MENEKIERIQLASNETIRIMMDHQNKQAKMYRNMMLSILVGFIMTTCITVGGILYFFSTYAVEVEDTSITVEGEEAIYNGVIGDNNTFTGGGNN